MKLTTRLPHALAALVLLATACQPGEPHPTDAVLTVTVAPAGSPGVVTLDPPGMSQGSLPETVGVRGTEALEFSCNQTITLTATPKPGYAFESWSGACKGSGPTAAVAIPADCANLELACLATFVKAATLTVTVDGYGALEAKGSDGRPVVWDERDPVTGEPVTACATVPPIGGATARATCTATGTPPFKISAASLDPDWKLQGWSGDCAGDRTGPATTSAAGYDPASCTGTFAVPALTLRTNYPYHSFGQPPVIEVVDPDGHVLADPTMTWSSSRENVVTVGPIGATGVVTDVGLGSSIITVTQPATGKTASMTVAAMFPQTFSIRGTIGKENCDPKSADGDPLAADFYGPFQSSIGPTPGVNFDPTSLRIHGIADVSTGMQYTDMAGTFTGDGPTVDFTLRSPADDDYPTSMTGTLTISKSGASITTHSEGTLVFDYVGTPTRPACGGSAQYSW